MTQIRRIFIIVSMFILSVSQAYAWEFSMSGNFTWEYYQFSQLGDQGFFGPYNQDNSGNTIIRLAARNGWLGHEIARRNDVSFWGDELSTGSDVAANYIYTVLFPKLKLNEALSLRGSYRIGAWNPTSAGDIAYGHLNTSRYLNSQAPGMGNSFSPGYWQTWYAEANLPWGIVTVGKQPNTIGLGLIIDSLENTTEAVVLGVPFGPFIVGAQYYFWGPGRNASTRQASNYPLRTDRSGSAQPHFSFLLLYSAGNISSETYVEYNNGHKGPESELYTGAALSSTTSPYGALNPIFAVDSSQFFGFANFKYFNGRLFFNTEVGFYQEFFRQNGLSLNQVNVPLQYVQPQTRYWELWAGMVECGVVAGPAKLSFLWAYYPGPDRRAGKLIDRQPTIVPIFSPNGGVNLYLPYSLLLGYDYGSGNGSITRSSSHGFITDASTYGIRLDYAAAANLNLYATFLYANRISQGYGWGWIRPDPTGGEANDSVISSPALQYGNGNRGNRDPSGNLIDLSFTDSNGNLTNAPNILERDLGYEFGGGIDWKLIEGYILTARVAYWKPGYWFKYACVDRRQPGWNNPNSSNHWGVNWNREINPIFGVRGAIQVDF